MKAMVMMLMVGDEGDRDDGGGDEGDGDDGGSGDEGDGDNDYDDDDSLRLQSTRARLGSSLSGERVLIYLH